MPRIQAPEAFFRFVARQLSKPTGFMGGVAARALNKGNGGLMRKAVESMVVQPGEAVADIGFGGGAGLEILLQATAPNGKVYGVDPSPDMVARAQKQRVEEVAAGRLEVREGRLEQLPLGDQVIDAWMTINTLTFVPDLSVAFAELARITSEHGRGVIGLGDPDWMRTLPFTKHGFILRPLDEVQRELRNAGFSVEHRHFSYVGHPYNFFVVSPGHE